MLYIGVDLGTSAVKLLLMDEEGDIKKIVSREYPLYFPHPVSYTHLIKVFLTQEVAPISNEHPLIFYVIFQIFKYLLVQSHHRLSCHTAVSYTHLDVYKRQILFTIIAYLQTLCLSDYSLCQDTSPTSIIFPSRS